jgi:hypothetical protein
VGFGLRRETPRPELRLAKGDEGTRFGATVFSGNPHHFGGTSVGPAELRQSRDPESLRAGWRNDSRTGQHRRASARTDRPWRASVEAPPALRRQERGCRPDSLASAEQPGFFSERNPRDAKRSPIFGKVMPSGTVHSEGLALHRSLDQRELDVSPRPFGGADPCQVPAPPALLGGTA